MQLEMAAPLLAQMAPLPDEIAPLHDECIAQSQDKRQDDEGAGYAFLCLLFLEIQHPFSFFSPCFFWHLRKEERAQSYLFSPYRKLNKLQCIRMYVSVCLECSAPNSYFGRMFRTVLASADDIVARYSGTL